MNAYTNKKQWFHMLQIYEKYYVLKSQKGKKSIWINWVEGSLINNE